MQNEGIKPFNAFLTWEILLFFYPKYKIFLIQGAVVFGRVEIDWSFNKTSLEQVL